MAPMKGPIPLRPRLADHVLARLHVVNGEERVILHDLETAGLLGIGLREWGFLAAADGTRDVEGIVLSAQREGSHAREGAVRAFLEQLHAAGLLSNGIEEEVSAGSSLSTGSPVGAEFKSIGGERALRPIVALPNFTLDCDGGGTCCCVYASVVFAPVEAARARALLPLLRSGGERHEHVFMPERGTAPTGGSAVALSNGACIYRADTGRCLLHEAGGPLAKPSGCRTFPATYTDDGETIRVSVAVECACVLRSVGGTGGASLVPAGATVLGDLDPSIFITRLPEMVAIDAATSVPRPVFLAWSRQTSAALAASQVSSVDMARALFRLADRITAVGLTERWNPMSNGTPLRAREVRPWIMALASRAMARAHQDASWRSERDYARRATAWIATTATLLCDPDTLDAVLSAPVAAPSTEAFYVSALFHGHHLVGTLPLAAALRDRAVRLLVARALPLVFSADPDESDGRQEYPLAIVEAMLRGHGLAGYAHDIFS